MQVEVQGQLRGLGGSQVQASEESFIQDLGRSEQALSHLRSHQLSTSSNPNGNEVSTSSSATPSGLQLLFISSLCTKTHMHAHSHTALGSTKPVFSWAHS